MYKYIVAATIAAGGFIIAPSAANAGQGCKFFQDRYLSGQEFFMPHGTRARVPSRIDNKISSVNCTNRCTALVYVDINFKGAYSWERGMQPRIPEVVDNKISSIKVTCS